MIICEGYKTPEADNNLMKLQGMLHGRRILDGCDFTFGVLLWGRFLSAIVCLAASHNVG